MALEQDRDDVGARRVVARWAVRLWPALLALVLVAPLMVSGGYPLARDLVFVPRQPLDDAALGLGDGSPRAVPLDAVVSVLTTVVDGGVLARVVLPLTLAVAAWGVTVLVRPLGGTAQVAAATLAVWNAYVVERLALGQWALLLAYAAVPWLVAAAARFRREGRVRDAAAAVAWAGLASLTPTGGLLAVAGLVAGGVGRTRRTWLLPVAGMLLQAPWLVAGLVAQATRTSDPAGIAAFAPDTEAPTGAWVALLGGGGIWDSGAEPATRTTLVAVLAAVALVGGLVVGWPVLRETWGRGELRRWAVLALVPAAVALAATTAPGRDLLAWTVEVVPGAGLLRDTQKLLAPAVILAAAGLGAATARLVRRLSGTAPEVRLAALLPVVLSPIVLLPDATTVTWPTVEPVSYPSDYRAVDAVLSGEEDPLVVTLPWRAYRLFDWAGHGLTSSDPAVRLLHADVVTNDSLQVGDTLVAGEGRLAARVGEALSDGPPARTLGPLGVSWVLAYPDDPDFAEVDLSGLEPVVTGDRMVLLRVPDVAPRTEVSSARRAAVVSALLLALLVWTGALLTAARGRLTRR